MATRTAASTPDGHLCRARGGDASRLRLTAFERPGICPPDHVWCACMILAGDGPAPEGMRYPDGGVLSAQRRARRKKLRLQAAQMSGQDMKGCSQGKRTVHV